MSSAISEIEYLQETLIEFGFTEVRADGDIGKITRATVAELTGAKAKRIQEILAIRFPELLIDGKIGKKTMAALAALDALGDAESLDILRGRGALPAVGGRHAVKVSTFADPADVRAFDRCKANGGSDQRCFKVGDNGIGKWGAKTAQDARPMIALPREVWQQARKSGGDKVRLYYPGREPLIAELADTMPALENIENGAGMDVNPAVAKWMGKRPPFLEDGVEWEWAA